MKRRAFAVLAPVVGGLLLSGCSSLRSYTMPDEENLLSGAGSLVVGSKRSADEFELIDIEKMKAEYGLSPKKEATSPSDLKSFSYNRDELQSRLVAASNQRCGAYLRVLVSSKAQTKMGWGGLATFLGGAALATTPASAAKVLTAGSTISTGFVNLYEEAYFSNLTLSVIAAGIEKKRAALFARIETHRGDDLDKYPVNQSISDALDYHAACNMVSGLETAGAAVKLVPNNQLVSDPAQAASAIAGQGKK
jgi:hypothetical protein